MGEWSIYGSNGSQKATVKKLEYSGEFMGETYVTCDVYAPSPISFGVGDYLEYRGERFVIDYDATRKKQARVNTYGSGFLYEGMRFLSYVGELKKCEFLDFVPNDNQIHYSQLPEFSFFAADVSDLADRIQANLDRLYTGNKAWTVTVAQGFTGKTNIDIQVSKITCFDALKLAYDQFEAQFVIRGRVITIGTAGSTLATNYKYGKGNGLKTIERSVDESDALITRLRAYGNTTNMPANYYRNLNTLCYADYYETLGPYADKGADLHFHPGGNKFANNWFTEKSGADAGHYWVEVSLDEELWITAIASTNAGNGSVGFSVVSTDMYGSNTQDMLDAFNTQLGTTGRLYFRKGVNYDNWGAGKESGSSVPASLFIDRLMLPSFPTNPDPYIDSSNIGTLGIREKSVYFDGSDPELPDIHPSLEGMTAHDIDPVHGSSSDYLDEIAADATEIGGGDITTDGQFVNMDEVPGFQVKVKDIGFDINSYLSTETATLSMKSGKCGGREFTIVKVEKAVGGGYLLTCQRTEDINLYFPYKDYPIEAGDKFVLTGIEMPDIYIQAASQRLYDAAVEYLEKHSRPQYVYAIKMDDIWMQRQADGCESVGDSYYWNIKEGDVMQVQDNDLGIYEGTAQNPTPISEVIDRLTIREGYDPIPQIEVVLRKEKPQGTIGILQNRIRQLEAQNAEQVKTINRQNDYITLILGDRINDIANQADHQQISWFGTNTPNVDPDNPAYPIDQWADDWSNHIGDMYYDKDGIAPDNTPIGYVFEKNNNSYQWTVITDPHTLQALAIASEDKDTIDGKRRVFVITAGSVPLPPYEVGDLWVNAIYPSNNTVTDEAHHKYYNDVLKCITDREKDYSAAANVRINDWSLASKYTDDSKLNNFLDGYSGTLTTITNQIDQKAETWYQSTDPSTGWDAGEKEMHEGDIWYNTTPDSNGNCHTYIYRKSGSNYNWEEINGVPEDLFDTVDGKAAIYVSWNAWMDGSTNNLHVRDLLIPASNITKGGVTYYANKVYRCTNKSTPTFQEIDYTDDAALNAFLNGYTGTLTNIRGDITNAQNTANAAEAIAAALEFLGEAYRADDTLIDHGLILSTIVALRDSNNKVWSGISGAYKSSETGTGYKGHGIAAWYGGGMADWEVYKASHPSATITDTYAKSLFRFDGSGYVASGNISWDNGGVVTIQGNTVDATTLKIGGTSITETFLSKTEANNTYVTKAFFAKLFQAYKGTTISDANKVNPNDTTSIITNLKLMVGTWTEQYLSALGLNSQGGGGTGSFEWQMLTEYDGDASHKINNNYLNDNVITTVNQTSTTGYVSNISVGSNHTLNVTRTAFPTASSSTLGMVKVGTTLAISSGTLNQKSGIIATTGTYRSVTVDTYGRVTAGTNPTTLSGYGITDAKIANGVITLGSNTITPLTSSSNIAWNKITGKPSWIGDNKPSYNFSEIGAKPTTLAGYGITDAVQSISISGDYIRQTKIDSNGDAVTSNVAHILERQYTYAYPQDKFATEGWYRVASIQSGAGGSSSLLFIDRVYNNANNEAYIFAISIAHAGSENANATITQVAGKYNTQLIDKIRVDGSNTTPYSHYIDIHIKTTTAGNTIKLTIVGAANLYNDGGIIFNPTTSKTYEVNIVNGSSTSRGHTISGTLSVGAATTLTGLLTANNNAIVRNTATNYHASYLEIGQIRLVYDHTNNAIKVLKNDGTNANFYATGTVSALGANTSGGGGTGIEMDEVWAALHTYSQATNHDIDARYLKFSSNGSGNGVANVAISNGALTVTKTNFLPLAGGTMTGTLGWTNATALPHKTDTPQYFLVIEPFADDGTTKYVTLSELKTAIGTGDYLPLTGGTISNTSFAPLKIERKNTANAAGIGFYNSNGLLGYIGMTGTANGGLIRWNSNGSTSYPILDSSNYTTYAAKASYFTNDILKIANGGTGSATTSPHFVFIGASSGTAASAPSFRVLEAADIPSLSWSKITSDKPTTLAGYGITDAYTQTQVTNLLKGYLTSVGISGDNLTMTKGGTTSNVAKILERTYTYSQTIKESGWYRIGKFSYKAADGGTLLLFIYRSYSSPNNEAYIFAITLAYNGGISISQLAGHYNSKLIDKIRVEYISNNNEFLPFIDIHLSDDSTSTSGNSYKWMIVGCGESFSSAEKDPTLTGRTYEYSIVDGAGVSRNFVVGSKLAVNGNAVILDADATSYDGSYLQIGYIRLVYDHANNAIKVVQQNGTSPANFYATGSVSALGANNNTSGGSGADINDVWDSLTNSTGTSYSSTSKIHSDHIDINIGGSGNAVTDIIKSGTSITLNKGTKFLPLTAGSGNPLSGHLYISSGYGVYLNSSDVLSRSSNLVRLNYGLRSTSGASTEIFGGTNGSISALIGTSAKLSIYSAQIQFSGLTFKDSISADTSGSYILTTNGAGSGEVKYITKDNLKTALGVVEPVTELGTSGNYLTWTKNGTANNITIPYATKASQDSNGVSLIKNKYWSSAFTNDGTTGWYTVLSYTNNYYYKTAILHITTRRNTAVILVQFYNLNAVPRITCLGFYGNDGGTTTYGGFTGNIRIIKTGTDKYNAIIQAQFYNPTNTTASYKRCGLYLDGYPSYWTLPDSLVKDTTTYVEDDISGSWDFSNLTSAFNTIYPVLNATYNIGSAAYSWKGIYGRNLCATVANGNNNYYASIVAASTFAANRTYTIPYVANGEFVMTSGDQKITGVKTFDANTLVVDGNQVSDGVNKSTIRFSTMGDNSYKNAAGTAAYAQNSGIRNCIRFDWYATAWAIGNVRGGGTDSQGFAIGYMNSGKDGVLHRFLIQPNGNILTNASITAGSEVTASSDERLKTINGDTSLTIKDIALAPSIRYTWNDKRDEKVHIGSIAQYWEKALPEAVSYDGNGIMSLNYGALALVSAITIARELMKHEDEITKLKKRVAELEKELKERRAA